MAATLLAGPVRAETANRWFLEIDNALEYGPVEGFIQIPAGGTPGSTSLERPGLDELGIDDLVLYELSLRGGWGPHTLLSAAHIVRFSGDEVLGSDLITHQVAYPAGTRLRSDIALDRYELGYGYRVDLLRDWGLSLTPAVDVVLLDFDYEVVGGGVPTGRSFAKFGYRLGGEIAWSGCESFDWLQLRAVVFGALPIDNTARILDAEFLARARVWRSALASLGVFLGVAYQKIEYMDEQTVPNEIEVRMGPLMKAGLSLRF